MFPGLEMSNIPFPKTTPEESDDDSNPLDSKPLSHIPGGINPGISHRSAPFGTLKSGSGRALYPLVSGGVGA